MDPLTALSLAGAVVQFVDFGVKIFSKSRQIYKSADGASSSNSELQASADRLHELCEGLRQTQRQSDKRLSKDELAIEHLSKQCLAAGEDLQDALEKLLAKPDRKWESFQKAVASVWKEKKILEMEKKLKKLSEELHLHLTAVLHDDHSTIMVQLKKLDKTQNDMQIKTTVEMQSLRQDLIKTLSASNDNLKRGLQDLTAVNNQLVHLQSETNRVAKENEVLASLKFPAMRQRHRNVRARHKNTFKWIFQSHHAGMDLKFRDWLKSGSETYWITGKAGSGKSTLMKHICDDKMTIDALKIWAKDDRLIVANYFLWHAGTALEKSQEGLLRSLLFEILRQRPELIPLAAKHRYENLFLEPTTAQEWTAAELNVVLEEIVGYSVGSTKFCFFIDGIDEYSGEPREIARAIKSLSRMNNVKICVSSRPWNAFEAEFGSRRDYLLEVHRGTVEDIRIYIRDMLEADPLFTSLLADDHQYQTVVSELIAKAQGVFLWVFLVVNDICANLPNADSAHELMKRIHQMPSDLEEYFGHMLESIPDFYRRESAEIMLIALEAARPVPLLAVSVALDDSSANMARLQNILRGQSIPFDNLLHKETVRATKRLKARCLDLMEVTTIHIDRVLIESHRIDFIHRSVHDYLRHESAQAILQSRVRSEFDPMLQLCRAFLGLFKILDWETGACSSLHAESKVYALEGLLNYSRQMENKSSKIDPGLLDEASAIMRRRGLYGQGRWTSVSDSSISCHSQRSAEDMDDPIMPYAIRWSLYSYISRKLEEVAKFPRSVEGVPLLQVALIAQAISRHKSTDFFDSESGIDPAMVALLLGYGAQPNQHHEGTTVWAYFVNKTLPHLRVNSDNKGSEIVDLLLAHGADRGLLIPRKTVAPQPVERDVTALLKQYAALLPRRRPIEVASLTSRARLPAFPNIRGIASAYLHAPDSPSTLIEDDWVDIGECLEPESEIQREN